MKAIGLYYILLTRDLIILKGKTKQKLINKVLLLWQTDLIGSNRISSLVGSGDTNWSSDRQVFCLIDSCVHVLIYLSNKNSVSQISLSHEAQNNFDKPTPQQCIQLFDNLHPKPSKTFHTYVSARVLLCVSTKSVHKVVECVVKDSFSLYIYF